MGRLSVGVGRRASLGSGGDLSAVAHEAEVEATLDELAAEAGAPLVLTPADPEPADRTDA